MVLVCLDLFLGTLPSAGLFAKKQLSGSLLPPFLSECILLLHAMLPGWYHSHNSPICPSRQGIPTTLSPHPWSGEAQHYPTLGILSLPTPSPELPMSDAAGNNFEANEQTHAQKRQWRQISTVCTKFHIIKWVPFATRLLPLPQCWILKENKLMKMAFHVFHHVNDWLMLGCRWHPDMGLVHLPRLFPRCWLRLVTGGSSKQSIYHTGPHNAARSTSHRCTRQASRGRTPWEPGMCSVSCVLANPTEKLSCVDARLDQICTAQWPARAQQ